MWEKGREREGEKEGQEKHRKLPGLNRMSTMIKKREIFWKFNFEHVTFLEI